MDEESLVVDSGEPVDNGVGKLDADPVVRSLIVVIALVVIALLSAGVYIAFRVVNPGPPRTAQEQQLDMLKSITETNPDSALGWADYAHALMNSSRYAEAERVLGRGAKLLPASPVIMVEDARLSLLRGDDEAAIKKAEAVYATVAKERQKQKADMAEKGITGELGLLDSDAVVGAALIEAEAREKAGDWAAAIKAYDRALTEDSTMSDVLTLRGQAQLEAGDRGAATKDFKSALSYIPDYQPALDGLAKAKE